jgi:hypothetical protein
MNRWFAARPGRALVFYVLVAVVGIGILALSAFDPRWFHSPRSYVATASALPGFVYAAIYIPRAIRARRRGETWDPGS